MLTLLALVQVVSAMKINLKLQNNPMAADKFSLVVISSCTIADLSATIDYAYRVFDSNVKFPLDVEHVLSDILHIPSRDIRPALLRL